MQPYCPDLNKKKWRVDKKKWRVDQKTKKMEKAILSRL